MGSRRAFTLVELLVVLVVMAVLASITLPQLLGSRNKAYDAQAKAELTQVYHEVRSEFVQDERLDLARLSTDPTGLRIAATATGDDPGWSTRDVHVSAPHDAQAIMTRASRSGRRFCMATFQRRQPGQPFGTYRSWLLDGVDQQRIGCYGASAGDGSGTVVTEPDTPCSNGIDDDGDGRIDTADPDCDSPDDISEDPVPGVCANGLDDDGDGLADHPSDPGCVDADDPSEDDPDVPACSNGIDDDGDGRIDTADPGCEHGGDDSEDGGPPPVDPPVDPPADPGTPYTDEVVYDHPWGYWRLEEQGGLVVGDSSGNGRHMLGVNLFGVNVQSTSSGAVSSQPNRAFNCLASVGLGINLTQPFSFRDFTIEYWTQASPLGLGGFAFPFPLGFQYVNATSSLLTGQLTVFALHDLLLPTFRQWGPDLRTGGWHHVVVTRDTGADVIRGYVDGALVGSVTTTNNNAYTGIAMNFTCLGRFDEVAVYDYALAPARIQAHHTARTGPVMP